MLTQRRGAVLRSDGSGQTPSGLQLSLGSPEEPPGAGEGDGSQLRPGAKAAPPARDPCKKLLPGGVGGCPRMLPPHPPPLRGRRLRLGSAQNEPQRQAAPPAAHPPPLPASFIPHPPLLPAPVGKANPPPLTHPPTRGRGCPPPPLQPAAGGGGGGGGGCDAAGGSPGCRERGLPLHPPAAGISPLGSGGPSSSWGPGRVGGGGGGDTRVPHAPWMTRHPGLGGAGRVVGGGAGARLFAGCIQWATP